MSWDPKDFETTPFFTPCIAHHYLRWICHGWSHIRFRKLLSVYKVSDIEITTLFKVSFRKPIGSDVTKRWEPFAHVSICGIFEPICV